MKFFKFIKPDFPFHKGSLESWIKILDDVTKGALLAMLPLIWMESQSFVKRISAAAVLVCLVYFSQIFADFLRKYQDSENRKEEP